MYGDGTRSPVRSSRLCPEVRAAMPALTPQLVMQQIIATGDAVPYDLPIGPRVNAFQAVSQTPTGVALDEASAPVLSPAGAAPNPIWGSGAIRFCRAPGRAKVVLYDAAGRRVLRPGGRSAPGWSARGGMGWARRPRTRGSVGGVFRPARGGRSRVSRSKVVLIRP